MNFKRNLFVITSALVGALALTGCDFSIGKKFTHFNYIEVPQDDHERITGDGYLKIGDYKPFKILNMDAEVVELGSAYETFRDYGGNSNIPSTGEQKIIVVPVAFKDYGVDKLDLSKEQFINELNRAFFGNSKNNEFVSVGEYFNKSSYGKLRLDGKVCDQIYEFPLSISEIKEKKLKRETLANKYYGEVLSWYKKTYGENDLKKYEIEGLEEGKNVPIYMVYTYPSEEKTTEDPENFFWAYTFSETPLSWSSYSFASQGYGLPDAHTYIHETGHLLGLVDYYPTLEPKNEETVVIEPTSFIDMMDASVGDETGFSKMFLNWTRPTYVTDDCKILVRSFTETGDLILVAPTWNETVFDEYYLIEFYTPTGLNTYDVSVGNNLVKLPKLPGFKIYHVDARLAHVSANRTPIGYCSNIAFTPTSTSVGFAHDNNTYDEPNDFQKNYLYQLILNNSKDVQITYATDSNLFRAGDEIPELKFNTGEEFDLKISIETVAFTHAVLKFEKPQKTKK